MTIGAGETSQHRVMPAERSRTRLDMRVAADRHPADEGWRADSWSARKKPRHPAAANDLFYLERALALFLPSCIAWLALSKQAVIAGRCDLSERPQKLKIG
jgi:hypothetical protein